MIENGFKQLLVFKKISITQHSEKRVLIESTQHKRISGKILRFPEFAERKQRYEVIQPEGGMQPKARWDLRGCSKERLGLTDFQALFCKSTVLQALGWLCLPRRGRICVMWIRVTRAVATPPFAEPTDVILVICGEA